MVAGAQRTATGSAARSRIELVGGGGSSIYRVGVLGAGRGRLIYSAPTANQRGSGDGAGAEMAGERGRWSE
jgi:hypothetical protein